MDRICSWSIAALALDIREHAVTDWGRDAAVGDPQPADIRQFEFQGAVCSSRVVAKFATTHSAVRLIEAAVPVIGPDPQMVRAALDGMATGADSFTPSHTQASAWRIGGRPVAAVISTTMDRI